MTDDTTRALAGRTVAFPEARDLQPFSDMLLRCGADMLSCSLLAIRDNPDIAAVEKWLRLTLRHPFDDVIFYTGEGVETLAGAARRMKRLDAFRESLRKSRKITRGPKPAQALRALDIEPDLAAEEPTTDGLIVTLSALNLSCRRVGVQLYGREPNHRLTRFLDDSGADVYPVSPYIYADESEDKQVRNFIQQLIDGVADAIAFTGAAQVSRLFKVARQSGRHAALHRAMQRTPVVAVGPQTAEALSKEQLHAVLVGSQDTSPRALIRALCKTFESHR